MGGLGNAARFVLPDPIHLTPEDIFNIAWGSEMNMQGLTEDSFNRRCRDLYSDNRLVMIFKYGNSWSALIGDNLKEGHAGFGDTVEEALADLSEALKDDSHYENNEGKLSY